MRKKLYGIAALLSIFCIAILFFAILSVGRRKAAPSYEGEWLTAEGNYTYPMTPYKEEWVQLDILERRESCNMPQELVDMLTTEELVNAALDYPLKMDYIGFSSPEKGLEHLKGSSNVYRELFEREDIIENLLKAYRELQVDYDLLVSETVSNPWEKSGYAKELILQLLIGCDEIFDQLTEAQMEELLTIVDERYAAKQGTGDDFTMAWSRNNPFLLGREGILDLE